MESGNSGSFQSSTGDEEFDSHGDGISALNNLAAAHVGSFSNQQLQPSPPPPPLCTTVSSYMYDHRQPPLQPLQNYQRSFMNSYVLDWSNNNLQRSETNPNEFNNPMYRHGSTPSQPPSMAENTRVVSVQEPPPPPPSTIQEPKRPRKRSRASRGAATTVLTTDTTNFRAMVQEFTGIPEPPFPSHHFQKSRLDIFGTVSGMTSPPYLRRPFPQKVNLPFSSSSSFLGSSSSSNTNNMNINATTNALTSSLNNNYQFTPQSSSFFNLQNQFVPSFLGIKTHQESRDFSSNDDFGGRVNNTSMLNPSTGFLGLISSDQRTSTNNNQTAVRWGNGTGSTQDDDQSHVITSAANSNFSFSSS